MKSVLLIMDNFAPDNTCAAIPNTKLTKYLVREGAEVTLITRAITPEMTLDENLLPEEANAMRMIRVDYGKLFSNTLQASRNKLTETGAKQKMKEETRRGRAFLVSVLKETYFEFRSWDWYRSVMKATRKVFTKGQFDCVYSSYPDTSCHLIAQDLVKRGIAKKWIADFRDPMYYEYHDSFANGFRHKIQIKLEKAADHVTLVSEGALDKFLCEGVAPEKITYIPNGYDPEDMDIKGAAGCADPGVLHICYAGSLYWGKRDFSVLFRALSELALEGRIDKDKVLIEYAGREWDVLESFARKYGMESRCKNYGFITRQQVMEIMSRTDCTVVSTHNTQTDQGVVTGKIFELLMVGKPIIATVNGDLPDSELGQIVRKCEAGIVYEQAAHETDYPSLKQWLQDRYQEKMETGKLKSTLNEAEREKYSYKNIAHQLYKLMEA